MTARKWCAISFCLSLMALVGVGRSWAAGSETQQWENLKAKMSVEGWTQVAEGIFERQMGPTKVERIGYGRQGIARTLRDLNSRLAALNVRYENEPTEDLAGKIEELSGLISRIQQDFQQVPTRLTSAVAAVSGASCTNICYSATADAYPLTATQGVGALAEAKFNSTCGYSGEVYAEVTVKATLNGVLKDMTEQSNPPLSGTSVTATAGEDALGGTSAAVPCFSSAYASVTSTALGISYSTSDTNSSCPAVPQNPTATISGSFSQSFTSTTCRNVTWNASASGGVSPYTYQWKVNGLNVGTGSSYTRNVCYSHSDFTLSLTATGANSLSGSTSRTIDVIYSPNNPDPCTLASSLNVAYPPADPQPCELY